MMEATFRLLNLELCRAIIEYGIRRFTDSVMQVPSMAERIHDATSLDHVESTTVADQYGINDRAISSMMIIRFGVSR